MSGVIKLSSPATGEFWEIPILFEDAHLLALNKPSGLLTSPDPQDAQRRSLMKLLHDGIAEGKSWARERGLTYLMNAHRLDLEVSGVLLLAREKATLARLADSCGAEKPNKMHVALSRGNPKDQRFEIDAKLAPHRIKAGLMCVDPKRGKRSRTLFEVLEKFSGYTLLRCVPLTDRKHQIRTHLRYAGLPVVGDALYGGHPLYLSRLKREYHAKRDEPERPLIGRAALHAEQLELPHPCTGASLVISAPWPKDFSVAVKYLRRFALE